MYRTAVESGRILLCIGVRFILSWLILPMMTAVLYIILLITWLPANTKKNLHSVSFYSLFVSVHSVFQQRKYSWQNRMPFLFSLFAAFLSFSFLDRWRQLSLLPRVEITVFSKNIKVNVKLIHTSGLGVSFFRYEVDYRSDDIAWQTKTLGW